MISKKYEDLLKEHMSEEEWLEYVEENYIKKENEYLRKLTEIAKSGHILPVIWVGFLRSIPGYNPEDAKMIESQYFDSRGFPCASFENSE